MTTSYDCTKSDDSMTLEEKLSDIDSQLDALEKNFDLTEVRNILIYDRLLSKRKTIVRLIKEAREKKDTYSAHDSPRFYYV
jgi:hypothetical protein